MRIDRSVERLVTNGDQSGDKSVNDEALRRTVLTIPKASEGGPPSFESSLIWFIGSVADLITAWGTQGRIKQRDRELRQFFPTENMFLSALGTIVSRNMAFAYKLDGPKTLTEHYKKVLDNSNLGDGWSALIAQTSVDLYTQDSGAFWEIVREEDKEDSPVVGVNHLDAYRCWPTGDPRKPVIYVDQRNRYHLLNWWNVYHFREIPSPIEGLPGLQFCALTRLLRAAQITKNIAIYKEEKTGGRHTRAIHIIRGLTTTQINDALEEYKLRNDSLGATRYTNPLIMGSVDPKAEVGHDTLELAGYPDNYDEATAFNQYVAQLAMAFFTDYQEFAPLPGGNLGTSSQSEIQHLKTRGKGPGLFMRLITEAMNFVVLPEGVEFKYEETDAEADKATADVRLIRAQTRAAQITSQELTPEAARQMAVDAGDISQEVFDEYLKGQDVTPNVTVESDANPDPNKPRTPQSAAAQPPNNQPPPPKNGKQPAVAAKEDEDEEYGEKHPGHPSQKVHAGGRRTFDADDPRSTDKELAGHSARVDAAIRAHGSAATERAYEHKPGGVWDAERKVAHEQILSEFEARDSGVPSSRHPEVLFMAGLPGAGKSTALSSGTAAKLGVDSSKFAVINADDFKAAIAARGGAPDVPGLSTGEKASFLHEESSYLAKAYARRCREKGQNVIWDATASSASNTKAYMDAYRKKGYKVKMLLVDTSASVSQHRAAGRYRGRDGQYNGRHVSLDYIKAIEHGPRSTYNKLKGELDGFALIDNNSGTPRLMESGGSWD